LIRREVEVISIIKTLLKKTFIHKILKRVRERKRRQRILALQEREMREWEAKGKPAPPPHIMKQKTIEDYARRFSLRILIETGTYQGDMVDAMKNSFTRIFSIELGEDLHKQAKERFHNNKHISIIHGDSGEVLPDILVGIKEPCLFWLDGHYSEGITVKGQTETPIAQELEHILDHPVNGHVILIDDARCFIGENDYPTIDELKDRILQRHPTLIFEAENDIIRIHQVSENWKS
jgi:hypothetical protein